MKNIGIFLRCEPYQGGAYQFWISVVDALVAESREHNFHIVLFADNEEWRYLADKYHLDYQILPQDQVINKVFNIFLSRLLPFKVYRKLCPIWSFHYSIILGYKIDVLLAPSPKTITRDLRIKSISPLFDLMHLYEPRFVEVNEKRSSREHYNRKVCRGASIILADSDVGRRQIVESYGSNVKDLAEKVKVLPFIPADYIYAAGKSEKPVKVEFDKYIFYPAQFWTHKNHYNLLLAISRLREEGINVNLVCAGSEKNALEGVKKLLREWKLEDQIRILGYVTNDEIIALYQHARALVMPTFFGPTNIPPLEAFVLGCPVAISGIYGIPEQVGDAALLFDPKSVEEIAECIKQVWMDDTLCEQLIAKGKERSLLWGQKQYADTLARYIDEVWEDGNGDVS